VVFSETEFSSRNSTNLVSRSPNRNSRGFEDHGGVPGVGLESHGRGARIPRIAGQADAGQLSEDRCLNGTAMECRQVAGPSLVIELSEPLPHVVGVRSIGRIRCRLVAS